MLIRGDKRPAGEHEKCVIAPTLNEVAVVVVDKNSVFCDILVHFGHDGDNFQRICESYRSYDRLQHPLIFC